MEYTQTLTKFLQRIQDLAAQIEALDRGDAWDWYEAYSDLLDELISSGECPAHVLISLSEARGQLATVMNTLSTSFWAVKDALDVAENEATDPDNDTPPPAAAEPSDMEEPTLEDLKAIEEGEEVAGEEEGPGEEVA